VQHVPFAELDGYLRRTKMEHLYFGLTMFCLFMAAVNVAVKGEEWTHWLRFWALAGFFMVAR
jgi:hypothetical protein